MTLIDVLRIQQFIFSTNRLRDVVAGSQFVSDATSHDVLRAISPAPSVAFSAGGNALLTFDSLEDAKCWTRQYSRMLLEQYPGLGVAVEHTIVEQGADAAKCYLDVGEALARRKAMMPRSGRLEGLSVTAECTETRGTSTHRLFEEGRESAISRGVALRREWHKKAGTDQWAHFAQPIPNIPNKAGSFPLELDHLGRTFGENSLLAVVHVDANRIGRRLVEHVASRVGRGDSLDAFTSSLGDASSELSAAMEATMRAVIERVINAVCTDEAGNPVVRSQRTASTFALKVDDGTVFLPIRPLVLGGDDITFVCDGRIAIDLAAHALEVMGAHKAVGAALHGCAGVAIGRTHTPFSRMYDLSESLVRGAKQTVADMPGMSAIDWHVGDGATLESVAAIRERVYRSGAFNLTFRPYRLDRGNVGSYAWLDERVLGAATDGDGGFFGPSWQRSRNKLKAMRDVLREGSQSLGTALAAWRTTAGIPDLPGGLKETNGFLQDQTPLLDALELLDIHMPLGEVQPQ